MLRISKRLAAAAALAALFAFQPAVFAAEAPAKKAGDLLVKDQKRGDTTGNGVNNIWRVVRD